MQMRVRPQIVSASLRGCHLFMRVFKIIYVRTGAVLVSLFDVYCVSPVMYVIRAACPPSPYRSSAQTSGVTTVRCYVTTTQRLRVFSIGIFFVRLLVVL